MQGLVFDECEIGWEVSEWHTAFLDLLVYLDPADGSVQHKPYSKPMNHRERIPWASAHPKDVKKGTFTGEMSRLAVLSSKPEHYLEALADLQNLYIARGYPTDLVRKWTKENSNKRWLNRHNKSEPSGEVFVLKSKYNPAWTAFNIHELQNTVVTSWRSSLLKYEGNMMNVRDRARGKIPAPAPQEGTSTPVPELEPRRRPVEGLVQRTLEDLWVRRQDGTNSDSGNDEAMVVSPGIESDESQDGERREYGGDVGSLEPAVLTAYPSSEASRSEGAPAAVEESALDEERPFLPNDPGWVSTGGLRRVGNSNALEIERVPDANYLGYTDRRWLVSRKRNDTLGNHVNKWRKRMLRVEVISADDLMILDRDVDEWR